MFDRLSDKQLQEIMNFIRVEKMNGTPESQLIDAVEQKGVSRFQAQHLVQNSDQVGTNQTSGQTRPNPGPRQDKPEMGMAILGTLAGVVVLIIGIAITAGSDGMVITYGAIVVGAIWTIRGIGKIIAASAN